MKRIADRRWVKWRMALTAFSMLPLAMEASAAESCDNGFLVANGQRCVQWDHITAIQKEPQPTDPGNYFYDFDKSYENMGQLKTDEPMIEADAALGGFYMYNGDYVRLGVSYPSFVAANGRVKNSERPPYRDDSRNRKLPYNLNAVKAQDGADIAAPNCTVCHSSVFQGQLVQGLEIGRAHV